MATANLAAKYRLLKAEAVLKARHGLLAFTKLTKPDYSPQWFHREICKVLDMFEQGQVKKLMIFVPPQHGKSELSSRRFPSYALGRNPNRRIALCSYGAEHAQAFNRDVQRIIDDDQYHEVFPDTTLNQSNVVTDSKSGYKRTANIFEVVSHQGFMKTVGVGGPLTGTTVDIGIIDDPFKDREEAESGRMRQRVWNWYTDVFETRLHNDSQQLMLFTRWHEDDLAGRALDRDGKVEEGGEWVVVTFPAIREAGQHISDYVDDPRHIGEALWEDRHSAEKFEKMKASSPRTYYSLAQQEPAPVEGNLIKRDWFGRYNKREFNMAQQVINFYLDTAYTDKQENDPTALLAWFTDAEKLYLTHCSVVRKEFPELIAWLQTFVHLIGYSQQSRVFVEPKASGKSVAQMLKRQTGLNIIEDTPPKDSKVTRVNVVSPILEAGRVFVPENENWVKGFLAECAAFPNATHDDQVDCLVGSIRKGLMYINYQGRKSRRI